jgi:hypothetical protein
MAVKFDIDSFMVFPLNMFLGYFGQLLFLLSR